MTDHIGRFKPQRITIEIYDAAAAHDLLLQVRAGLLYEFFGKSFWFENRVETDFATGCITFHLIEVRVP